MQKRGKAGKAQAALEFLITYGWAIVVVIGVVAALTAYGVFKTPSARRCGYDGVLMNGLFCEGFKISSNPAEIQLKLRNGLGYNINITNITIMREDNRTCHVSYINQTGSVLEDGSAELYVLDGYNGYEGCTGKSRKDYKGNIYLTFSRVVM